MLVSSLIRGVVGAAALVSASPVQFPVTNDGFPNPNNTGISEIQQKAHGTLSNSPLPPTLDEDTLTSFKIIAFNEIFEVAFFNTLIKNITDKVPGYADFPLVNLGIFEAIQAQEELHALTANTVVTHYNETAIQPCEYVFPVNNYRDAIKLAQLITDLTVGTLQDVQARVTTALGTNAGGIVTALAQVIGQEGQQDGYFRISQGFLPSAQPFLTGSARAFLLSALQPFLVPGSCPSLPALQQLLPTFAPLTTFNTNTISYGNVSFTAQATDGLTIDASKQKLVYINGANVPVVQDFYAEKQNPGDGVTYNIRGPFNAVANEFYGLTIAAITNSSGPFSTPADVADATVFGPAFIEFF